MEEEKLEVEEVFLATYLNSYFSKLSFLIAQIKWIFKYHLCSAEEMECPLGEMNKEIYFPKSFLCLIFQSFNFLFFLDLLTFLLSFHKGFGYVSDFWLLCYLGKLLL